MTMDAMNKALLYRYLLLMLIIAGNQAMIAAANDDEETDEVAMRLLEQTIQKNMSLQGNVKSLNQQIKDWNDTIKSLEKEIQEANKNLKKQQQQLEKIQPTKYQEKEAELTKRHQELQAELERLNKENAGLEAEIDGFNQLLGETSQKLKELEGIKQDVAEGFVTENESYLDTPLSKLEIDKLRRLQQKCETYKGYRKVEDFSKKLENMISFKETYDAVSGVVHQPFDKNAIYNAQRSLSKLNHLSESQMEEVENLRHQLNGFKVGLIAFNEFITRFQKKRAAITSAQDVDFEVNQIRKKDFEGKTMAWHIENEIYLVPYLKKKFDQYMKAIKSNPKSGGLDVENEIRQQYENAIK